MITIRDPARLVDKFWWKTKSDRLALLTRTDNQPAKPLDEREPIKERDQKHYYAISSEYDLTCARKSWRCMNDQCYIRIETYTYYYKFKGSRSWWNMRRHHVWDRICQDCYFDHVLSPTTDEWRIKMGRKLEQESKQMESILDKIDNPNHAQAVRRR